MDRVKVDRGKVDKGSAAQAKCSNRAHNLGNRVASNGAAAALRVAAKVGRVVPAADAVEETDDKR